MSVLQPTVTVTHKLYAPLPTPESPRTARALGVRNGLLIALLGGYLPPVISSIVALALPFVRDSLAARGAIVVASVLGPAGALLVALGAATVSRAAVKPTGRLVSVLCLWFVASAGDSVFEVATRALGIELGPVSTGAAFFAGWAEIGFKGLGTLGCLEALARLHPDQAAIRRLARASILLCLAQNVCSLWIQDWMLDALSSMVPRARYLIRWLFLLGYETLISMIPAIFLGFGAWLAGVAAVVGAFRSAR